MRLIHVLLTGLMLVAGNAQAGLLSDFLDGLHAYSARFEQVVRDANGEETERSSGTLMIERPGRFRWEYQQPYPQLIVADGNELFLYDPDLEQVTVRPMDDSLSRTPALLLTGDEPVDRHFEVEPVDDFNGLRWVALRPRGEGGDFEELVVGFDAEGEMSAMKITDGFGQTTELTFFDAEHDPDLPADAFVFVPPPGTDVIRAPRPE